MERFDLLFSPSFAEGEARASLGGTLGIAYWLVLLTCLRLAWPRLWPPGSEPAAKPPRRRAN